MKSITELKMDLAHATQQFNEISDNESHPQWVERANAVIIIESQIEDLEYAQKENSRNFH